MSMGLEQRLSARERFFEVAFFGSPDRVPLSLRGIRPATLKRWWGEGLPYGLDASEYFRFDIYGLNSVNITFYPSEGFRWEPSDTAVNLGPIPPFKYKILRMDERYRIWTDSLGVTQMGFQEDWKNGWGDFATRTFIDFPVKTRGAFDEIKKRYNPGSPERYPPKWREIAKNLGERGGAYLVSMVFSGPFWWIRDMMGLERTLFSFFREKDLVHDILDLYVEFHLKTLKRAPRGSGSRLRYTE